MHEPPQDTTYLGVHQAWLSSLQTKRENKSLKQEISVTVGKSVKVLLYFSKNISVTR